MANTYTQLYIQFVMAVKGRENLINKTWKDELYKYITSIVQNKNSKLLAINGVSDHIHIFTGYNPSTSIPDLMKDIKVASSIWINSKSLVNKHFNWQEGYGAFSYSRSHIDKVCKYIANQEAHHKKQTFRAEYISLLKKFEIEFNEKYLFDFLDDV